MVRITREERLRYYRMIIEQIYPLLESPVTILHVNPIIEFLHDHPDIKQEFMRYTHVTGQTNSFHARVYRMIQNLREG